MSEGKKIQEDKAKGKEHEQEYKKKEDINTRRKIAGTLDTEVQRQTGTEHTEGRTTCTQDNG